MPSLLIGCGLKRRRDLVARGAGLHGFDERWTLVGVDRDSGLADDVIGGVRLLRGLTGHMLAGKQAHVSTQEEPLNGACREGRPGKDGEEGEGNSCSGCVWCLLQGQLRRGRMAPLIGQKAESYEPQERPESWKDNLQQHSSLSVFNTADLGEVDVQGQEEDAG